MDDRLIVALDLDHADAARLATDLAGTVAWVKVGMTLFYEFGPGVVTEMRERGFDVFIDLKLHDIPHQVRGAAARLARLGAGMVTVHASGGSAMVSAAVEGAAEGAAAAGVAPPAVIAVTVLTSLDAAALAVTGVDRDPARQAALLAELAMDAGAAGVVCSPQEASAMRELVGPQALVVCPGVRPAWASADDQARVATPRQALAGGASHLVVGRPITADTSPAQAARRVIDEMEGERDER